MSLFQCSKCGCAENTATSDGGYLLRLLLTNKVALESYRQVLGLKPDDKLGNYCCVCNPAWYNPYTCGRKANEVHKA